MFDPESEPLQVGEVKRKQTKPKKEVAKRSNVFAFIISGVIVAVLSIGGFLYAVEKTSQFLYNEFSFEKVSVKKNKTNLKLPRIQEQKRQIFFFPKTQGRVIPTVIA